MSDNVSNNVAEDVLVSCPMCGFEFDRRDTVCAHGCPLGPLCNLISCPNCGYEFPEQPKHMGWLQRLFMPRGAPVDTPDGVTPVSSLNKGQRGDVVCLGSDLAKRYSSLSVYGVVPGAEIVLVQQSPSCVIRVDETELALDPDIAREILVRNVRS